MLKGGRAEQRLLVLLPVLTAVAVGGTVSLTIVSANLVTPPLAVPIVWLYVLLGLTIYYVQGSIVRGYVRVERTYHEDIDGLRWVVHVKRLHRGDDPWASVVGPYCPQDFSGMVSPTRWEPLSGEGKQWTCPKCNRTALAEGGMVDRVRGLALGRWNRGERSHDSVLGRVVLPAPLRPAAIVHALKQLPGQVGGRADPIVEKVRGVWPRIRKR